MAAARCPFMLEAQQTKERFRCRRSLGHDGLHVAIDGGFTIDWTYENGAVSHTRLAKNSPFAIGAGHP